VADERDGMQISALQNTCDILDMAVQIDGR
jgi:hypothetical protein